MQGGEQTPLSPRHIYYPGNTGEKSCYTTVSPAVPSAASLPTGLIIPERRYFIQSHPPGGIID